MFKKGIIINDRYKTVDRLGTGGMGEVWKCKDEILGRDVALKFVNESYSVDNPKSIKILKDEARLGAKLIGHPNIVNVLDYGIYNNPDILSSIYYIVMECVEGVNLYDWINKVNLIYDNVTAYNVNLYIAWEICKGIHYAHSKGILHRDIKPVNIFVSKIGFTKVGDFGIARFMDEATRTHTMWQANTPSYCSPEQWKGNKPSAHSDIYQLGCTLYELFTGKLPFKANNMVSLMNAHLNEEPVAPKKINNIISSELSNIIMKALDKDNKTRADLWEINDIIAKEIQGSYDMIIDVHSESKELIDSVAKISEFSATDLSNGEAKYYFTDFSEVLSETIQIILSGIKHIKIEKIIKNKEISEVAVTSKNN